MNQRFRGRLFFRVLYFLPVIITTGVVMNLLFMTTSRDMTTTAMSESITDNMFSVEDVMGWLNLPPQIAEFAKNIINSIFDLIWKSGIQIVLFIAGLQSIPKSLYEASTVEGASKWEEFWFITFPMLSRVTLLVGIFTMIELFTDANNTLVSRAYTQMQGGNYDETSAMLWMYFMIVGFIMGILVWAYHCFLVKRWD